MSTVTRPCQICHSASSHLLYKCKDHSVSKEQFSIVICDNCSFAYTNPIPDEESIHKYYQTQNYISHSDTKKGFINALYHQVRKITLNQKEHLIRELCNNIPAKLLDIGCGTGYFLKQCKDKGWVIEGSEPDSGVRKIAQANTQATIHKGLEEIDKGKTFDIVTMWHVLEHIHEVNHVLECINSFLKETGFLIIAVPNYESEDAKIYKEDWAAFDVPRHLYHFTKKTIEHLLMNHSFILHEIVPMKFDSFYVSMISEKYKNSGLLPGLINSIINGFKSNLVGEINHSSLIYIFSKKPIK